MKITYGVFSIAIITTISFIVATQCELYTSVEEIAKWPDVTKKLSQVLDDYIELQQLKVKKLKKIQDSLMLIVNLTSSREIDDEEQTSLRASQNPDSTDTFSPMMNPVNAFVVLNRLKRAMDSLYRLLDYSDIDLQEEYDELVAQIGDLTSVFFRARSISSIDEDLAGSGQALLRLQLFYNLSMDSLINGTMRSDSQDWSGQQVLNLSSAQSYRMDAWDCFALGKLAYRNKDYGLAIRWLFKSLEVLVTVEQSNNREVEFDESEELKTDILDHMAFAAYKLGLVEYSAKLTQTWLDRDPNNERARENLKYYLDVLAGFEDYDADEGDYYDDPDDELVFLHELEEEKRIKNTTSVPDLPDSHRINSSDTYSLTEDEVARRLCRSSGYENSDSKNKCETQMVITDDGQFFPALRVETLNDEPKIIRIYDIITENEAKYFRQTALPYLERSGIRSSKGSHISDNRIAKTAWLESDGDPLVSRVESRLGSILNISMYDAERFQVVNYGLGGFYGPHFDVSKKEAQTFDTDINDRLATILVYLNRVEAGGSTAFPRLNISVIPIERSAIVWFNTLTNGDRDERTLHTGCPVLLGSKWIATKWPTEQSNSFMRPCKLNDTAK